MDEWREIRSFPGYSVSESGAVRNDATGFMMTLLRNQAGVINVGLTKNQIQYKRTVSHLVAQAFLVPPRTPAFDSVINLDGDRTNNHVENILWRPRWFATKYFRQFKEIPPGGPMAVEETISCEKFPTSWLAAITYGLLDRDIRISTINETEVWPTYQIFRKI